MYKRNKCLIFKNRVTKLTTLLFMGFKDDVPYYQFSSKEIPITGIFTGYPKMTMIKWMSNMGYDFITENNINSGNEYFDGYSKGRRV